MATAPTDRRRRRDTSCCLTRVTVCIQLRKSESKLQNEKGDLQEPCVRPEERPAERWLSIVSPIRESTFEHFLAPKSPTVHTKPKKLEDRRAVKKKKNMQDLREACMSVAWRWEDGAMVLMGRRARGF